MGTLDQLTNDYSRGRVPDAATVSSYRITAVMIGAMITLPVFVMGVELSQSLGIIRGIAAFSLAGAILAALAGATGILAANSRLTTWLILQYPFGTAGAKLVSAFIGVTILGWYGATVDIFARAVEAIVLELGGEAVDRRLYLISASLLMTAVAFFGFKGLDRLSKLAVPIMLLVMTGLVISAVTSFAAPTDVTPRLTVAKAVSAIVGGFSVGVTMFPDVCRYARSGKDAMVASSFSFGLGVPIIMLFAAVPVVWSGERDFLAMILVLGLGVPALLLLLLATWTTNAYNLYSSSLVYATILQQVRKWKLVIAVGIVGTLISLLPILDNLLHFLNFLAVMIPPLAGVYLADFYLLHKQRYDQETLRQIPRFRPVAFAAWLAGAAFAYLSSIDVATLTTVPALDAIAVSFVVYVLSLRAGLVPLPRTSRS